jgi:hypothetical protein
MPESQLAASDRKLPLHRRPWMIMGGIALFALGLLGFVYFKDDPPPEDRDLIPLFTPGGGPDNPLAVFCREMEVLHYADAWYKVSPEAKAWHKGSEAELQRFLDKYAAGQRLFDELMRTDAAAWRWPGVDENMDVTKPLPGVVTCMSFASAIGKSSALLHARAGRRAEALDEGIKLIRFGNQLAHTEHLLIHHLAAITVHRMGLDSVKEALLDGKDEVLLRRAAESLAPLDVTAREYGLTLRGDYYFSRLCLPLIKSGEVPMPIMANTDQTLVRWLLLPNRQLAEDAAETRLLVASLDRGWPEALRTDEKLKQKLTALDRARWRIFLKPNAGGKILQLQGSLTANMMRVACGVSALQRMALVTLALRRFELAHGQLPDTLNALVPDYLPAVPLDPFNDRPLRWDATNRWVYSVAGNGIDDHGSHSKPERATELDMVMPYWWEPQAKEAR